MSTPNNPELVANFAHTDTAQHDVQVLTAVLRSSADEAVRVKVLSEMNQVGFVHIDVDMLRRQRILTKRKREYAAQRLIHQVRSSIMPIRVADTLIDYEDD